MENWNENQRTVHDGVLNNSTWPEDWRLAISPVTIQTARAFAAWTHRQLVPPADAEFVIGVQSHCAALVGVVFIDRPASWRDDGCTAEITCLSTDGTPHACTALLDAAWSTARAEGYQRLIINACLEVCDTSPRAARFRPARRLPAWQDQGDPYAGDGTAGVLREIRTASDLWETDVTTDRLSLYDEDIAHRSYAGRDHSAGVEVPAAAITDTRLPRHGGLGR